ncbi:MAG: hypothetical protein QNL12_12905 [Acidimicrobiia bacterium]|nr:hypothetical protein [Acidimicrobiia bacterium]MDX2468210.1 hypothetical protein [Acidimicrobiia bacterium]
MLLLHGWGGASTDMAPLASSLAAAGLQAVFLDLPGYGSDRGGHKGILCDGATRSETVAFVLGG